MRENFHCIREGASRKYITLEVNGFTGLGPGVGKVFFSTQIKYVKIYLSSTKSLLRVVFARCPD